MRARRSILGSKLRLHQNEAMQAAHAVLAENILEVADSQEIQLLWRIGRRISGYL